MNMINGQSAAASKPMDIRPTPERRTTGIIDHRAIRRRWEMFGANLDERNRRLFAAAEVRAAGRGGLKVVRSVTGLSSSTIERGLKELDAPLLPAGRIRHRGGGRLPLVKKDPTLLADLQHLVEPATLDHRVPLKCPEKLAAALRDMGHAVSTSSVRKLLVRLDFPLPQQSKRNTGGRRSAGNRVKSPAGAAMDGETSGEGQHRHEALPPLIKALLMEPAAEPSSIPDMMNEARELVAEIGKLCAFSKALESASRNGSPPTSAPTASQSSALSKVSFF